MPQSSVPPNMHNDLQRSGYPVIIMKYAPSKVVRTMGKGASICPFDSLWESFHRAVEISLFPRFQGPDE